MHRLSELNRSRNLLLPAIFLINIFVGLESKKDYFPFKVFKKKNTSKSIKSSSKPRFSSFYDKIGYLTVFSNILKRDKYAKTEYNSERSDNCKDDIEKTEKQ